MKSRFRVMSDYEIKKTANREIRKYTDSLYDSVSKDCTYQALAVAFYILHRDFGFGAARLKKLKDFIEDEYVLMSTPKPTEYTTRDVQEYLKSRFDIDFEESNYT